MRTGGLISCIANEAVSSVNLMIERDQEILLSLRVDEDNLQVCFKPIRAMGNLTPAA